MSHIIVVLDDGETFSDIRGTSICVISDESMKLLCEGHSLKDIDPMFEVGLKECTLQGGAA